MNARQKIVRVRRNYNKWVANQTLEDYALRFTAEKARKWSNFRVANAALGAISFLALEAIGGAIILGYGFYNATAAILAVSAIIFATGAPVAYYAAKYGVDIDLLTRGAGFGYIGSTITSLIYASFTFLFFAIEAAIMSLALELCFGVPLTLGYIVSSIVIIPLVTHGVTFISRLQLWTQPLWIFLQLLPFVFIGVHGASLRDEWTEFSGAQGEGAGFDLLLFGAASSVAFALIAQIGEQVDFLRFLPRERKRRSGWWVGLLSAGPGWIIPGALKLLAGSFLAVLAIRQSGSAEHAAEPTQMYLAAFEYAFSSPELALALTGIFVVLSQIKINVTNAYAGSLAWSNFFSRLTHTHPGRVVWLVFNVAIALVLMEIGIFKALEKILALYSIVAIAWIGALVSDLVVNKPLGLSPPFIEFKRAHLYDINPVGVGAMILASAAGFTAHLSLFGETLQALSSYVTLGVAFISAPAIAALTRGRFYIARGPHMDWRGGAPISCCICEHEFEPDDMAMCPAYSGPICSLCCSLDALCHDECKQDAPYCGLLLNGLVKALPAWIREPLHSSVGNYLRVFLMVTMVLGAGLSLVYLQAETLPEQDIGQVLTVLGSVFLVMSLINGVAVWLYVLAKESRRIAEEESLRQNRLLSEEIEAHKVTDAKLQRAKETAEAANQAKSRYVAGLSHELRTPLNAILGYAQLLERDGEIPAHRTGAIGIVRRSAEHLSVLIDGLLDISKIEAGRFQLHRQEVRIMDFLDQLVNMFRLQTEKKGIAFHYEVTGNMPPAVYADENRLRQVLINLLSNAIKFTREGQVALRVSYRNQVAVFEIEDTGIGIHAQDMSQIFEPFQCASHAPVDPAFAAGTGLGLTIARVLTETMGGDIGVTSTPGEGSIFRVRLMLSEVVRPGAASAGQMRITGYHGPRRTVIIADDDPVHREIMHEILAPLGFTVLDVADGAACIALARDCESDLILLDVRMPGMDGWEVARRLRGMGIERPVIIIVSANLNETHLAPAPDRVHDGYLIKPVNIASLLDTIGGLLKLEWRHEPIGAAARGAKGAVIIPPAASHIEELRHLGQIGHVRGIQAKLDEIERSSPASRPFVARMRQIAQTYDFRRFNSEIERLQSGNDR
jgi:signal transduction histidine kinase/CheY-like chemotaxis protein/purine-cytosine permease-like protein